ncbi:uncharacterized protein LOC125498508 [Beta vulgaris subsp. vulgaris]|uniref:uncharacterized protein LOC125498508 n=1 Tax=Beta vulgaris subsp. vulgaris TaxID=3555 RepID=UPI002036F5B1|nr:uncharacterized protein LOC125498508 [Beta vulgaris subsp. vulgaris]
MSSLKLNFFNRLPNEITINILGRVASQQPFDLFCCKLSCKILKTLSDDDSVMKKVVIETIIDRIWMVNSNAKIFFGRCLECKNPDALTRYGLVQIYTHNNYNNGLCSLIEATKVGHAMSSYLLGLIWLSSKSGDDIENGHYILTTLLKQLTMESIIKCREIFKRMLKTIWIRNRSKMSDKPPLVCKTNENQHMKGKMWDIEDVYYVPNGYDTLDCYNCKCDREVRFFYSVMK